MVFSKVDMFGTPFELGSMTAHGTIQYDKDDLNLLSACLIQVDGVGKITGSAYGMATGADLKTTPGPLVDGKKTFKWELPVQMMPDENGKSRDLKVGKATGIAFYRRPGGQVSMWTTPNIKIKA
jgi:hypothetical protein